MEILEFEDGQIEEQAYVEIDGEKHYVTPAKYTGKTPLSAYNLNQMQKNISNVHKYYKKIEIKVQANSELELPCFYKVGSDVLDVYYLGERLIKDDAEKDIEGHYQEVGESGSISNKIIVGWDVDAQTEEDDSYFEFVVRGEYEGGDA